MPLHPAADSVYRLLTTPLDALHGIGKTLQQKLGKRGICTVGDLLLRLPRDYHDDSRITPIGLLTPDCEARVRGKILQRRSRGHGRNRQVDLLVEDASGRIHLSFFHSGYMMRDARIQEGREILARGRAKKWQGRWQMTHPEWCLPEQFVPGIKPVYGTIGGIGGRRLVALMDQALHLLSREFVSPLDRLLADQPTLVEALHMLHQPKSLHPQTLEVARKRLKTEEVCIYMRLMLEKRQKAECMAPRMLQKRLSGRLLQSFPYPLTPAQQQAWQQIEEDLESGRRMHRLLQGDVGAGKTWIAALCMAKAVDNGYQAALLAPTEVLAAQHGDTLAELLQPLGIEVELLCGSTKAAQRRKITSRLADGRLMLVVGTHALLSDDVVFDRLGLALVDEQHRFGVRQRWALSEKGGSGAEGVHTLAMTATPIPRSLALALYGDMQLSLMRGMPPGRKPVETRVLRSSRMRPLHDGMRRILTAGGRIYWIVPRIDEDEDGVSVEQRVQWLRHHFPDACVQGLHGRMKPGDKQKTLMAFAEGDCRILVSTTVVEVGVNVPEARLIIIEQADRYGLAQLHQLRGRVGRSSEQGYCILITGDDSSEDARERLRQMVRCHDGLDLAEADMRLRGSGDALGVLQSGQTGFRLIDPVLDAWLIRHWHEHLPEFEVSEAMRQFWRPAASEVD